MKGGLNKAEHFQDIYLSYLQDRYAVKDALQQASLPPANRDVCGAQTDNSGH